MIALCIFKFTYSLYVYLPTILYSDIYSQPLKIVNKFCLCISFIFSTTTKILDRFFFILNFISIVLCWNANVFFILIFYSCIKLTILNSLVLVQFDCLYSQDISSFRLLFVQFEVSIIFERKTWVLTLKKFSFVMLWTKRASNYWNRMESV